MEELFGDDVDDDDEMDRAGEQNQRPKSCGVLCFHSGTEEMMLQHAKKKSHRGECESILAVIDEFCHSRHWMMHIGDKKRSILKSSVLRSLENTACPVLVELGSYCGYSAVTIGMQLGEKGRLYCIERERKCVEWTRSLIEYAELSDRVTVIEGSVDDATLTLLQTDMAKSTSKTTIDFILIDHDKQSYASDLKKIEEKGLFSSGAIVFADNILSFGQPLHDYLDYVRDPTGPFSSSMLIESEIEYADGFTETRLDGIEISVHK